MDVQQKKTDHNNSAKLMHVCKQYFIKILSIIQLVTP